MKVYGDLFIRGSQQALSQFISALDCGRRSGWSRQTEREAEVGTVARGPVYGFHCNAAGTRPACELWIATTRADELYVSNVVPVQLQSLSCDQYNSVLRDFVKNCAMPAANTSGVAVELGKTNPQLEDFLSRDAAEQLRQFSRLAARSGPQAYDQALWKEFLLAAHREDAQLEGSILRRWLVEEEDWPEDLASRLANDYQRERASLSQSLTA